MVSGEDARQTKPLARPLLFLSLGQTKQGQRAGRTLTGTWQDAKLPVKPCVVQGQAFKITGLALG